MSIIHEYVLSIFGKASNKTVRTIGINYVQYEANKHKTLMQFLIENQIRIASSCSGEGVCKKCVVNDQLISCQITLEEFLKNENNAKIITIDYL